MADKLNREDLQALAQRLRKWLEARDLTPDPVPLFCQFERMATADDFRLGDLRELADTLERVASEAPVDPIEHMRNYFASATPKPNRFDCPECGQGIAVDEDGCCRSCGSDAVIVLDGKRLRPDIGRRNIEFVGLHPS